MPSPCSVLQHPRTESPYCPRLTATPARRKGRLISEIRQPDVEHVGQSLQLVEHTIGQRLIDVDGGERVIWPPARAREGASSLVIARDIDARAPERRSDAPDHARYVAVADHQHPAVGPDVDVEVVDADHAAVAAADERSGDAHATARRVDFDADRRFESGLRCAGARAELDALFVG